MNQVRPGTAAGPIQIPAELLRSIPRDCSLTCAGRFVLGAVIAMILGAVCFSVGAYMSAERTSALKQEMAEHGQIAPGVVIKTYRTGDDPKRDVFLYQFSIEGKTYAGRTEVGAGASSRYQAGSNVPVRYLPARPQANWIDGYPPSGVPLFVIPLLSGGLLITAYAMSVGLRRQQELLSEGRAALARVKKVTRLRRGEHKKQRAHIEFALLSGARQEAYVDFGRNAPQPESTIVIVYDRENPRRVLRYPPPLVRLEKPESW